MTVLFSIYWASSCRGRPEDAKRISAVAAGFFSEASGVAHILEGQLLFLKPLMSVHGTQRLLTSGNQVLVVPLTYMLNTRSCFLQHQCGCHLLAVQSVPAGAEKKLVMLPSSRSTGNEASQQLMMLCRTAQSWQQIKQCCLLIACKQ